VSVSLGLHALLRVKSVAVVINFMTIKLKEPDLQLIILAMAHLAVERPEMDAALTRLARRCGRDGHGTELFNDHKFIHRDDLALANQVLWLTPKTAKTKTRPFKPGAQESKTNL